MTVLTRLSKVADGVRWFLREATGESRYDAHVDQCRLEGRAPMSRRAYERHRADLREHQTTGRCC